MTRPHSIKIQKKDKFEIVNLPLVVKAYGWAMSRKWKSGLEQILIGTPIYLIFFLLQRVYPFKLEGVASIRTPEGLKRFKFNAKNTQFDSIYRDDSRGGYESEVEAIISTMAGRNAVFYDIGSNWGIFSINLATMPGFKGKIVAFEPFPSTFRDLVTTVSQLGINDLVTCLQVALSDKNKKVFMKYQGLMHSGFAFIDKSSSGSLLARSAIVPAIKLDSLSLEPPTIIKIDAQFHENEIIQGGKKLLKNFKPLIIIENCLNFHNINMTIDPLFSLTELGYQLFFPCWKDKKRSNVTIPTEANNGNYSSDRLMLVPINPENRFLYRDQINILAIHKSKTHLLEEIQK